LTFLLAPLDLGCFILSTSLVFVQFAGQTPLSAILTPAPTRTKEEKLLIEMQHHTSQSASSVDECNEILRTERGCNVMKSVERITRPEWEALFPQTEFFLVKYDRYGGEFGQQKFGILIIEQDGRRYAAETFDRLLATNNISITDENREPVAKAFALMTLANYLEEEIVFTEWTKGNWPASFGTSFNYALVAWTKIQGLRISWGFRFQDGHLTEVEGVWFSDSHEGDYIDVPVSTLPFPASRTYYFHGE
jgi:hypothetical protein